MNKAGRPRHKRSKGKLYGLDLTDEQQTSVHETIERDGTTTVRKLLRKLLLDWVAEQNGKNLF